MARILALSFEGTIVENDLPSAIYERFAAPEWSLADRALHAGDLSPEEFHIRALDLVEASEDEMVACARAAATVRPGLVDLVNWAEATEWMPVVISDGLDFIVEAVLESLGLDHLARQAGRVSKLYRWRVRYLSPRGIELAGGFKVSYVRAFQSAGDFVAFAGSSPADEEAADAADVVFAPGGSLLHAAGHLERVYPFETFFDLQATLAREAESWA